MVSNGIQLGALINFAFGGFGGGGGGGGDVNYVHQATPVTLINAQIRTLPTLAVEVIPAPGDDRLIVPWFGFLILHLVVDYTNISAGYYGLSTVYLGGSTIGLLRPSGGFLDFGAPADVTSPLTLDLGVITDGGIDFPVGPAAGFLADDVNKAVTLRASNAAGDYTGGDPLNTLRTIFAYFVIDTTTGLLVPTA